MDTKTMDESVTSTTGMGFDYEYDRCHEGCKKCYMCVVCKAPPRFKTKKCPGCENCKNDSRFEDKVLEKINE